MYGSTFKGQSKKGCKKWFPPLIALDLRLYLQSLAYYPCLSISIFLINNLTPKYPTCFKDLTLTLGNVIR